MTTIQQPGHQHHDHQRRARLVGAAIGCALIGVGLTGLGAPAGASGDHGPAELVQIFSHGR